MIFREAHVSDVKQIQAVRNSVKENKLSDAALVTNKDCEEYLTVRGKGWVCEVENSIVGFAIADLEEYSIWALFVQPGYDGKGIGKKLYNIMMDWYFSQTKQKAWLTTSPGTRAEIFYKDLGWLVVGRKPNGEIKFELSFDEWKSYCSEGSKTLINTK